jgi:hypothetical protein
MKKLLGIVVLGLLLSSNVYAETIFDIKSKDKNTITIEAFEPTNYTELQNNKINFQEVKEVALKHCNSDVDWDLRYKMGGTYEGVYQAGRIESVIYNFRCKKSSSTQIAKNDNRMSASKKTCLELGFTSGTEKFGDCVLKIMSMNNTKTDTEDNNSNTEDNNSIRESAKKSCAMFDYEAGSQGEQDCISRLVKIRTKDLAEEQNTVSESQSAVNCDFANEACNWRKYKSFGSQFTKIWGVILSGQYAGLGNYVAGEGKSLADAINYFHNEPYCKAGMCKVTHIGNGKISDSEQLQIAERYYGSNVLAQYFSQYNQTQTTSTYTSNTSTLNLSKKQKKKFAKYMRTPEESLCIDQINGYGWFSDPEVRQLAINTRGIECSRYNEAAYIEEQKRDAEFLEATKKAFDSGVDAYYGVSRDSNKKTIRCNYVGKSLICN